MRTFCLCLALVLAAPLSAQQQPTVTPPVVKPPASGPVVTSPQLKPPVLKVDLKLPAIETVALCFNLDEKGERVSGGDDCNDTDPTANPIRPENCPPGRSGSR